MSDVQLEPNDGGERRVTGQVGKDVAQGGHGRIERTAGRRSTTRLRTTGLEANHSNSGAPAPVVRFGPSGRPTKSYGRERRRARPSATKARSSRPADSAPPPAIEHPLVEDAAPVLLAPGVLPVPPALAPEVPAVPLVPLACGVVSVDAPPLSGYPYPPPSGDTQALATLASAGIARAPPVAAGAPVEPPIGVPVFTPTAIETSVHFQVDGQSLSVVQVVALDEQYPGKELVVVQLDTVPPSRGPTPTVPASTRTGSDPPSTEALDDPVEAAPAVACPVPTLVDPPLPTAPPPEQPPITLGSHAKPSPQSALALHGNCHLNAHSLVVVIVHVEVVITGAPASHFVFGAQEGAPPPPEHDSSVSV